MDITLARIAEIIDGSIKGDSSVIVNGAAPFENAGNNDITFAADNKFLKKFDQTEAGAVIVPRNFENPSTNLIQVDNPRAAFSKVLELLYQPTKPEPGVSRNSCSGRNLRCGKDVSISPFVSIGHDVSIGNRVSLHPSVVIGNNVLIGDDVVIYPNVTIIEGCRIGSRVIIHSGTVIGSDGFGFAPDGETYRKMPQTGIVQIDDDVEIGAGNTIDRATFGKTWIKKGVKTDNLVHIGHNAIVGENTLIIAQAVIGGSVTIGSHSILGGQSAVKDHVEIGSNVIAIGRTGIAKSIPDNEIVSGAPALPHKLWLRVQNIIPKLPELKKMIFNMDKRIKSLENKRDKEK